MFLCDGGQIFGLICGIFGCRLPVLCHFVIKFRFFFGEYDEKVSFG